MRETPLYQEHLSLGGKMVDFNGWALPLQFQGIIKEHKHTRTRASIFDCSHMGEFRITGHDAMARYDRQIISDVFRIPIGRCRLGAMLNQAGGIIDDVITFRMAEEELYAVNNAGPLDTIAQRICGENPGAENVSHTTAKIDVQGPEARTIVRQLGFTEAETLKYFNARWTEWQGHPVLLSRTGYTGELGYELYLPHTLAPPLWKALLEFRDVEPAGLGARDTLRTEAGYSLSGQDFSEDVTPFEAGMEPFIAWDTQFVGKQALEARRGQDDHHVLAGIRSTGRRAPRHGFEIRAGEDLVGHVTSGTFGPSVGYGVGLARIAKPYAQPGTPLTAGRMNMDIEIAELPHYKEGTCRLKF